ncbi:coiled-coil domain-containing protein 69 isoform X2 [Rhea pennata]|uniref:coiled-coil domain-containing protein 69 isoform X2 n=1 Tax=Rhea pennata TaxID=8795 RepID=UPI002E2693D1
MGGQRRSTLGPTPPAQDGAPPRRLKPRQPKASRELKALKAENAGATLLPEDGKEKAALPGEQRTGTVKISEEEKESLRQAREAETQRLAQDVKIQVEKGKDLELKEQLSELFNALKREHEETLQELQRAHDQEKLLLAESHQRSQEALQETIDALNSQLKSFQEKMKRVEESLLSRDYKKHIEEHGSPSPFWEQELESLHFVIEMKNEHIHGLDKKLLNLETVVEQNLQLEEKVKTLLQENEDLHVRTQNHLIMTRQLSEELLAARGALEKESQLREQARREKEELLYRVLNGGEASPFPVPSTEVPLIAT